MRQHLLSVLLTIAGTALGQTTWIVGTGGMFSELQQAIDSPSVRPGDVLQLVPGRLPHEGFTLAKGITVRGPAVIQGDARYRGSYLTEMTVPSGQHVRLVDLDFRPGGDPLTQLIRCRGGLVSFDRCQVRGQGIQALAGSITFDHCDIVGGARESLFTDANVAAVASTFSSGTALAGQAVLVNAGSLHGSGITITGPPSNPISSVGLSVLQGAQGVWLADSTITGYTYAIYSVSLVQLARSTVNGAVQGGVTMNAPLLGSGFAQSAPQLGQPYDLTLRGPANTPFVVLLSLALVPQQVPGIAEPVWLPGQHFVLATGAIGATGTVNVNNTIPASPLLRNVGLWAHPIALIGAVLHAAPPTGGVVR